MTKRQRSLRPAGVALCAALAFSSTSVLAQPAPEAVADVAAAASDQALAAAPAATPADATPPAAEAAAAVQPVPISPATPAPATASSRPTAAARTTAPAARPAVPARAAPAARLETAQAIEEPRPAAAEAPAPVVAPPAAAPMTADATPAGTATAPTNANLTLIATVLAALVVLGLAIWGFVAIGRRKRADERFVVAEIERPIVAEPMPLAATPADRPHAPAPAPAMAHGGASVPLPRRLPASFEERDALLKRMIDARPDRANPFTNRRARLRRARLILQSLDRDFGDTKPWIDLSQYPGNWPEFSRSRYAAA